MAAFSTIVKWNFRVAFRNETIRTELTFPRIEYRALKGSFTQSEPERCGANRSKAHEDYRWLAVKHLIVNKVLTQKSQARVLAVN